MTEGSVLNVFFSASGLAWTILVGVVVTAVSTVTAKQSRRGRTLVIAGLAATVILGGAARWGQAWYKRYEVDHGSVRLVVQTLVRDQAGHAYAPEVVAHPGQQVKFVMIVQNIGTGVARSMVFGVNLAPYETVICGSPRLVDSSTGGSGITLSPQTTGGCLGAGVFTTRQYVDDIAPGASESLFFTVTISSAISVGNHPLQTVTTAQVGVKGKQIYNVGVVTVNVT